MSEAQIIAKYQFVIKALLPYANEGRLLAGLNKFTGKLSSSVRKTLKAEVERLMSFSYEGADNSSFAIFPVRDFNYSGFDMRLDEIGENILQKEIKRFFDKYTVGVRESVISSEYYQHQLKIENFKRNVDRFSIEAQSLTDIDFGENVALIWSEVVDVECNGSMARHSLSSVSLKGIVIESRRVMGIQKGLQLKVHLDKNSPLALRGTTLICESGVSNFNKQSKKHELFLAFTPAMLNKIHQPLKELLTSLSDTVPLKGNLESERTIQIVDRHILLDSSPWLPVFISDDGHEAKVLVTNNTNFHTRNAIFENLPNQGKIANVI